MCGPTLQVCDFTIDSFPSDLNLLFYLIELSAIPNEGLQEFIEALSFLHYIREGQLIMLADIQQKLTYAETLAVTIPVQEYLLGIADLTGELMRMCINAVGRGQTALVSNTCSSLREIHEALASMK